MAPFVTDTATSGRDSKSRQRADARRLAHELAELRASGIFSAPAPADDHKPHNSYRHEAFMYRDSAEFLDGTLSFVRDAVELRQPVMVALVRPRLEVLRRILGPIGDQVQFVDLTEFGGNPARIIQIWLDFIEQHGDGPIRGIAETQWSGRRPEEAVECQVHDGLLNLAIDPDVPLWLRCPYDVSALAPRWIEAAQNSHPALVERGMYRGSTSYGGLHHVNSLIRSELPPAPGGSARLAFAEADLGAVREHLTRAADDAGLDQARSHDLVLAIAEIAATSVQHGGGKGELLTWLEPDALVCEISDQSRLSSPLIGRRVPLPDEGKGRGLSLANQTCDLVQTRSTSKGTLTRVFTWL